MKMIAIPAIQQVFQLSDEQALMQADILFQVDKALQASIGRYTGLRAQLMTAPLNDKLCMAVEGRLPPLKGHFER